MVTSVGYFLLDAQQNLLVQTYRVDLAKCFEIRSCVKNAKIWAHIFDKTLECKNRQDRIGEHITNM